MTRLLNKAMERVAVLTPKEQDAIAAIVLEEIEDEARWHASFTRSQDALARLADQARREIARGEVLPYDPATKPE